MEKFEKDIDNFISKLSSFEKMEQVFNPWAELDFLHDIGENAPKIRCKNLRRYLLSRKNARYILIAEAPGYQGCHFSGIPMTSERLIISNKYDTFQCMCRSSDETKLNHKSKVIQKNGFCEPTATIVWKQMIEKLNVDKNDFILWNTFPFHPHKAGNILSNRTPSGYELECGKEILKMFIDIFCEGELVAIGNTAKNTLEKLDYKISVDKCVRHPANGGASKFSEGMKKIILNF